MQVKLNRSTLQAASMAAKAGMAGILLASAAPGLARNNSPEPMLYTVEPGDTLEGISKEYLAGKNAVLRLQRVNRIANPRRLQPNRVLRIPRDLLRFKEVSLRVASYSGRVEIAGQPVKVGSELPEGALVQTAPNAFVTFMAAGGGRVSLPSNSRARLLLARRYQLDNLLDIDFEVLKGRAEFSAPKLRSKERFRTRTPAAVTAVRGTEFRVGYLDDRELSTTEVTEGGVAVAANAGATMASAGFGVSASATSISPPEALLPPPAFLDPGAIQSDATLVFVLEPMAGAVGYRVQLARDAGFLDVVDETVTQDTQAEFVSLENGRYFVRSRAIAASGLEGLSDTVSFRRKRLGAAASVEEDPLGDGFKFGWRAEGEGTTYFAFQLWDKADPSQLLIDDVGIRSEGIVITDLPPARYAWRVAGVQAEPEGLLKIWGPTQELLVTQ